MACAAVKETVKNAETTEACTSEPLDTLQMTVNSRNGLQMHVPALHVGFMEPRSYVTFRLPPLSPSPQDGNLSADEEEWLETMSYFVEDLQWVLKLPYHRFWSQIIYDENVHRFLESYICKAPRDYDANSFQFRSEISSLMQTIHKLVFLIFLRMSTYKESKDHHIRPTAFGEIIYDNFLFDVPKIMDLCVLYGIRNPILVTKMVNNIFNTNPKYMDDLHQTSVSVLEAFSRAEEKLFMNCPEKHGGCYKLEDNTPSGVKDLSIETFHDVINYIADTGGTLFAFLEIYSPACQIFHQHGAITRIATFYEQVIPAVEKEIHKFSKMKCYERILEDIKQKVVLSKSFLVKVFRSILNFCGIDTVLNSNCNENKPKSNRNSHAEDFLEIFMEIAPDKIFLHDYNILFPLESDLELFNEMGINLEPVRLNYIFSSIHDTPEICPENFSSSIENGARPKQVKKKVEGKPVKNLHSVAALLKPDPPDMFNGENENSANASQHYVPNELKLKSLIQLVVDVFPDLGEGFVEKCLEHYSYEAEKVIDVLLTGSLPAFLDSLNRDLKRVPVSNSVAPNSSTCSVLSERRSIFDNDEFDVFSNNEIDIKRVHMGKKDKTPSQYEVLDKDDEFLKQLILNYGSEETEDSGRINIYEDEYDDTYDSAMVGLKEPTIEDEPDEPAEEKPNDEPQGRQPRPDDFCENPEILRQRANERYQAKVAARNRGGAREQPNTDRERQQKGRNKSRAANHNRRNQSDFKKSRGMMNAR